MRKMGRSKSRSTSRLRYYEQIQSNRNRNHSSDPDNQMAQKKNVSRRRIVKGVKSLAPPTASSNSNYSGHGGQQPPMATTNQFTDHDQYCGNNTNLSTGRINYDGGNNNTNYHAMYHEDNHAQENNNANYSQNYHDDSHPQWSQWEGQDENNAGNNVAEHNNTFAVENCGKGENREHQEHHEPTTFSSTSCSSSDAYSSEDLYTSSEESDASEHRPISQPAPDQVEDFSTLANQFVNLLKKSMAQGCYTESVQSPRANRHKKKSKKKKKNKKTNFDDFSEDSFSDTDGEEDVCKREMNNNKKKTKAKKKKKKKPSKHRSIEPQGSNQSKQDAKGQDQGTVGRNYSHMQAPFSVSGRNSYHSNTHQQYAPPPLHPSNTSRNEMRHNDDAKYLGGMRVPKVPEVFDDRTIETRPTHDEDITAVIAIESIPTMGHRSRMPLVEHHSYSESIGRSGSISCQPSRQMHSLPDIPNQWSGMQKSTADVSSLRMEFVLVPPGRIDFIVVDSPRGSKVAWSGFSSKVVVDDYIVGVDGKDTRGLSAVVTTKLLNEKKRKTRLVAVRRRKHSGAC